MLGTALRALALRQECVTNGEVEKGRGEEEFFTEEQEQKSGDVNAMPIDGITKRWHVGSQMLQVSR